ncbi:hypothetical protein FGB62_48g072 [Gracilaria domingensis]|nr:hypothetical protein FGB62_48g072 [Gracilaria domingensis]
MTRNSNLSFTGNDVSTFLGIGSCINATRRLRTPKCRGPHSRIVYPFGRPRVYGSLNSEGDEEPVGNEEPEGSEPLTSRKGSLENPGTFFTKLEEARKGRREVPSDVRNFESAPSDVANKEVEVTNVSVTPEREAIPNGIQSASRALWRIGWFTWWLQLILTVIAAVILLFAFLFPGINVRSAASAAGFAVSGVGIVFAFLSLFWTYGYTRLALWLGEKHDQEKAKLRINRRLRFGMLFSITGMVILLLGLQAIVGTLLARLLGTGIVSPYAPAQNVAGGALVSNSGLVQPVDILVVQACANGLTGLLIALVSTIWFRAKEKKWTAEENVAETKS